MAPRRCARATGSGGAVAVLLGPGVEAAQLRPLAAVTPPGVSELSTAAAPRPRRRGGGLRGDSGGGGAFATADADDDPDALEADRLRLLVDYACCGASVTDGLYRHPGAPLPPAAAATVAATMTAARGGCGASGGRPGVSGWWCQAALTAAQAADCLCAPGDGSSGGGGGGDAPRPVAHRPVARARGSRGAFAGLFGRAPVWFMCSHIYANIGYNNNWGVLGKTECTALGQETFERTVLVYLHNLGCQRSVASYIHSLRLIARSAKTILPLLTATLSV